MSNKHLLIIFFVIGMVVWVLSGNIVSEPVTADDENIVSDVEEVRTVRGVKSRAEHQIVYLEVRGQTKANRIVQVKSEISGKIEFLPGEKGSRVNKGDLLCRVALDDRQNQYRQAMAELQSAQLEFDGFADLKAKGLQSEVQLAKAKAALAQSKTRAKQARLALEKTSIIAPFSGVVDFQPVEIGDFLTPGAICVSLIEIDPILIAGQVAEKSISQIGLRDEVEVILITGQKLSGRVSFIGHSPDMATRTFPIEVIVGNPGGEVRAGLTAEMRVPVGRETVHLISPASMVLDDRGQVGVKIVDSGNRVRFMKIKVVDEGPAGIFVKGLPEEVNLIIVGQEEVFEAQTVNLDFTPLAALVKQ